MSTIGEDGAIVLENISKLYPGVVALDGANLVVKKGTIHGFLGPNGAGKTTTMKIISGLIPPTSGKVKIAGRLGYLPDVPPLYRHMSVRDFLFFVYDIQMLNQEINEQKKIERLNLVLEKTGLKEVENRTIEHLSKGFQQRVGIAEALIHGPDVIILDEPTVGLDPVAIKDIRDLIKSLKSEHTILFSSHLLHEVELLCDEITIISKGKILLSGPIQQIKKEFQGTFQVNVKVKKFDPEWAHEFKKAARLDDLKIYNENQECNLICYSSVDSREEISRFLVEKNCGLLKFNMEEAQLEEIFKFTMQTLKDKKHIKSGAL